MKLCLFHLIFSLAAALSPPSSSTAKYDGKTVTSVHISGLEITREPLIRRLLTNRTGRAFSADDWISERNRLEGLGIFSDISLNVSPSDSGVNLEYRFRELIPVIPFLSLKITDQNGYMTGPAIAFLNMFGHAERLEAYYKTSVYPDAFSAAEYMLYLQSKWVSSLPLEYEIFLVHNDSYNSLKLYNESSYMLTADFYYRLTRRFKIIYTDDLFYVKHDPHNEIFSPGGMDMFLSSGASDIVPKIGFGILWDSRDNLVNTHRGIYQELRFSQYGGCLGGPADYREFLNDTRIFFTLAKHSIFSTSLLFQYRPGRMGAYDLFHIGGTNTLRTYTADPGRFGQHELLFTEEYRYEFFDRLHFTLFNQRLFIGLQWVAGTDIGVLWNSSDRPDDGRTYAAFYTGLHILFPGFNRIRLEWGFHRGEGAGDRRIKFGFTAGLWEKSVVQRWRVR